MVKHFSGVSTSSLPFKQVPRMESPIVHQFQRFGPFKPPGLPGGTWNYAGNADCCALILLSTNPPCYMEFR